MGREHQHCFARFEPFFEGKSKWVAREEGPPPEIDPGDGLPVPPREIWAGYGTTPEEYVTSGRHHWQSMSEILKEAGLHPVPGQRVLDFGCAAGRMTRCFHSKGDEIEVWGVDQNTNCIYWCQRYLSPPFRFLTTTTFPHLPFEDNFFDLIYAGSVFTHIGDLEDAWLMELRRIATPGATLYLTVSDNTTIQILKDSPPGHWLHDTAIRHQVLDMDKEFGYSESGFDIMMAAREPGNSQVFHDADYIRRHWGQFFQDIRLFPEAYGYQTAVLMNKPPS